MRYVLAISLGAGIVALAIVLALLRRLTARKEKGCRPAGWQPFPYQRYGRQPPVLVGGPSSSSRRPA